MNTIMKQLVEGMNNNNEISFEVIEESQTIQFDGKIIVKKNGLERICSWNVCTYRINDKYIALDDWDVQHEDTTFNGIKIDNYNLFIEGWKAHGMTSIAESLKLEVDKDIIAKAVQNHKTFKKIYKGYKIFELCSIEEQKNHFIDLLKAGKDIGSYIKRKYNWLDSEGNLLSNEEILEL